VVHGPGSPARDDRDADLGPHRRQQLEVEPVPRAVRVHGVEQDLAGAQLLGAHAPLDGVEPGPLTTTVRRDLELPARGSGRGAPTTHVGRQHQHLRPEPVGHLGDQLRPGDGRGVHADLVGSRPQQPVDVVDGPHPAAHRERDEHLLGGLPHHVVRRLPSSAARGDVEEGELVRALLAVRLGQLDRVPGVAQVREVDALDHPPGVDVEARDDPRRNAHPGSVAI
jgi:hypothetical protein